ncbi:MAG: Rne/Rng family ribonuclease [Alphaproteobacteria bacterium]|nr:Rne/Rng family ribonuclease [Alphaproteobacteria bacterium]
MAETILVNVGIGEVRIAIADEQGLSHLVIDRHHGAGETGVGAIYLGRVTSVVPGMEAAFVELGTERSGFLSAWDARPHDWVDETGERRAPPIAELVHEGQAIVVQATKEPLADKGARLSTRVSLPGRYLVLVPNADGVFISRRIEDEAERARLTEMVTKIAEDLKLNASFIVRTAASGADAEDLAADIAGLWELWIDVADEAKRAEAPVALYADLGPVERFLRDHVNAATRAVLIDDETACQAARAFVTDHLPDFAGAVERYTDQEDIFEAHRIAEQMDALLEPKVGLPSGGHVVIEGTEALTSVDVNSGRFTQAGNHRDTALATNLEAAAEIARQLRVRDIGGLIVIDFIHMDDPDDQAQVIAKLQENLVGDKAPVRLGTISEFGLLEMTRKRTRDSVHKRFTETCQVCDGQARVPTVETVALALLWRAEREGRVVRSDVGKRLELHAAEAVIDYLEEAEPLLLALEQRTGCSVELVAAEDFARRDFEVVRV